MMDEKIKQQWVKALRSGEYSQAKGWLYDGEGYCCLGVLAHIHPDIQFHYEEDSGDPGLVGWYVGENPAHKETLPIEFIESIGLGNYLAGSLANDNDNGTSFAHIADRIEDEA